MFLFLILGLIIGVLAVVFALQNIVTITVVFLSWKITASLALILALAVISGLVVSILVSIPEVVQNYFVLSALRKKNKELELELQRYKNIANGNSPAMANNASLNNAPHAATGIQAQTLSPNPTSQHSSVV